MTGTGATHQIPDEHTESVNAAGQYSHSLRVLIGDPGGLHMRPAALVCTRLRAEGCEAQIAMLRDDGIKDLGPISELNPVRMIGGPRRLKILSGEAVFFAKGGDSERALTIVKEALACSVDNSFIAAEMESLLGTKEAYRLALAWARTMNGQIGEES